MDITQWIRSQAAAGQPLKLHAVARKRPDMLEQAPVVGDALLSSPPGPCLKTRHPLQSPHDAAQIPDPFPGHDPRRRNVDCHQDSRHWLMVAQSASGTICPASAAVHPWDHCLIDFRPR